MAGRFNFTELTRQGRADINDIDSNFDKIEELGITADEVHTYVYDRFYNKMTIDARFNGVYTKNQVNTKLNDYITKSDSSYSIDEMDTGTTWIDGKPIYRKTYTGDEIVNNLETIDISELDIDQIFFNFNKSALCWNNSNAEPPRWMPIIQTSVIRGSEQPSQVPSKQMVEIFTNLDKSTFYINCGTNVGIVKWVLTIEYTKTTDSAAT